MLELAAAPACKDMKSMARPLSPTKSQPLQFTHQIGLSLAEKDNANDEHGKPKHEITLSCLVEGPGNPVDNRWYKRSAIQNLESKIYSRRKVFVDHLIDEQAKMRGDSLRDWAATIRKTWIEERADGRLERKVKLKIHEDWLWQRCEDAPDEIALSIEGTGAGQKEVIEGHERQAIDDITNLSAFKFVPYPGNAKMGADLVEGQPAEIKEEDAMDLTKLTLAILREGRADIVAEIEAGVKKEAESSKSAAVAAAVSEAAKKCEAAIEQLNGKVSVAESAAKKAEEKAALAEKAKAGDVNALTEQFRAEMRDGFAEQAKVIQSLREENLGLKQRLDEKEVRERLHAKDLLIDRLLSESDLPAEAITEVFKGDLRRLSERKEGDKVLTVEEQVRARIADRKKLCAGGSAVVTESGAASSAVIGAKPANREEEQVMVDEAFRKKYSREYGMTLTPETALAEYRKRKSAPAAAKPVAA